MISSCVENFNFKIYIGSTATSRKTCDVMCTVNGNMNKVSGMGGTAHVKAVCAFTKLWSLLLVLN